MTKETQYCLVDEDNDPVFFGSGMDGHYGKATHICDASIFTKKIAWSQMEEMARRHPNLRICEIDVSFREYFGEGMTLPLE